MALRHRRITLRVAAWLEDATMVVRVWAGAGRDASAAAGADEADLGGSRATGFVLGKCGERVTRL